MTTTEKIMALFDHAIYAEESYVVAAYRETICDVVQALVDECDGLRKAAQMALGAMRQHGNSHLSHYEEWNTAINALRKELGHE